MYAEFMGIDRIEIKAEVFPSPILRPHAAFPSSEEPISIQWQLPSFLNWPVSRSHLFNVHTEHKFEIS
jgi:hypothetical protein